MLNLINFTHERDIKNIPHHFDDDIHLSSLIWNYNITKVGPNHYKMKKQHQLNTSEMCTFTNKIKKEGKFYIFQSINYWSGDIRISIFTWRRWRKLLEYIKRPSQKKWSFRMYKKNSKIMEFLVVETKSLLIKL